MNKMDQMLSKYNGRFIKKYKDNDAFSWIYDINRNNFVIRTVNWSIEDIKIKIEEYLSIERNNILNEMGL